MDEATELQVGAAACARPCPPRPVLTPFQAQLFGSEQRRQLVAQVAALREALSGSEARSAAAAAASAEAFALITR